MGSSKIKNKPWALLSDSPVNYDFSKKANEFISKELELLYEDVSVLYTEFNSVLMKKNPYRPEYFRLLLSSTYHKIQNFRYGKVKLSEKLIKIYVDDLPESAFCKKGNAGNLPRKRLRNDWLKHHPEARRIMEIFEEIVSLRSIIEELWSSYETGRSS